ncbi:uncharacterized protein LOC130989037 isoform X1 [Salvia miltiorrhiza]|uniref:uncharacterized protein LOC130989037 isoform X1 n=2 Tax=Salvia miltiorrhiza TaxID=226208 RepID=UPI0025AC161D|nr:uncharacterized protein LOC130989037 isoform X1 [Salvia miltiorrhiza]
MQQLLPVAIRGVLSKQVRYDITRLCFFFNVLCNKVVDVSKLEDIQKDITITLCLLEKHFPPSFFDIMVHLTIHLVREVKLCGPVWYRWMYPFERFMRVLKGYVRNRNCPEGCIAECYIAEEALEFCSEYLHNVHTVGLPSTHRQVNLTKPLSAPQMKSVDQNEWEQAHRYMLTNDDVVAPLIEEYFGELKIMYPRKVKNEKWLQDEHNRTFIPWLRKRVANAITHTTQQVSERLKWLARGPNVRVLTYDAYMINGVTFHTKTRDNIRAVQNSGVSLVAKTMQVASAKDSNPIVSDMTFYGVIDEIWELDYNIFREVMFKCSWVENNNGIRVDDFGFTLVNLNRIGFKSDSFMLGSQAKQVFYVNYTQNFGWSVVLSVPSVAYTEEIEDDDVSDFAIHHQHFSNGLPPIDVTNEIDPSYVRVDCDGTWVDNTKS